MVPLIAPPEGGAAGVVLVEGVTETLGIVDVAGAEALDGSIVIGVDGAVAPVVAEPAAGAELSGAPTGIAHVCPG